MPFLLALISLLLSAAFVTDARAQTADYRRPPVLLIHGYFVVDQAGTFTWSTFKKKMIADGWPEEYLWTPSFDNVRGCNEDHVNEIEAWVEAIRKKEKVDRIDLVCHSFGCLNALTWLKERCGVHRVRQFVMLAGAAHGTRMACLEPFSCAADQMCIPMFGDESWKKNDLLVSIHGCDETPGDVMYTSVWSDYDEIIRPPEGSILAGAQNIEVETKLVGHGGIFMCDECYALTKEALLGAGGLNEDGPGWDCLPEACRPVMPEPDAVEISEPMPDASAEGMPDAVVEVSDSCPIDAPAAKDLPPEIPGDRDRGPAGEGVETDLKVDDPGLDTGLDAVTAPRKGGGCQMGNQMGGPGWWPATGLVLLGLGWRRRVT